MNHTSRRIKVHTLSAFLGLLIAVPSNATFYPNSGDLYYDGNLFLSSNFVWTTTPGPWTDFVGPGYEHDLWVFESDFFLFNECTTFTTLPTGYDDCPTADYYDINGPVFSFGSHDAELIQANTFYGGGWLFVAHNSFNPQTGFKLQGQQNRNNCWGYHSIWCYTPTGTKDLITGYGMQFGAPIPITLFF